MGAMSFTLAYGMKVVIPAKIGMLTTKIVVHETKNDDENLEKFRSGR